MVCPSLWHPRALWIPDKLEASLRNVVLLDDIEVHLLNGDNSRRTGGYLAVTGRTKDSNFTLT